MACSSSELLMGFLNAGAALPAWLARHAGTEVVDEGDLFVARDLQSALLMLLRAHSGCDLDEIAVPTAEDYLERTAQRYPLVPRVTAAGVTLAPAQGGVLGVFGGLLAAVADLSYRGVWGRAKVCKDDTCHDAFFDKTRNSSGLYCSSACASKASMRAYRSRQKAA